MVGCEGFSVRTFLWFDCVQANTQWEQLEVNHNLLLVYEPRIHGLLSLVPLPFKLSNVMQCWDK